VATGYTLELVEVDDDISFGRGDHFWKQLVTKLWTKRGELWNYEQDAYQIGGIIVDQEDIDVLKQIDSDESRFVQDMLGRISGGVRITRHP
jgi:hypothetical protein